MTTKWTKYSFVCNSECDALIEYTLQAGYTFNDVTVIICACGSDTTCVSVEDATIQPNQTKEEQMQTTTDNHYMTREFLESRFVEDTKRIQELEQHSQQVTQRSYTESAERTRMRDEMQEWTLEALDNDTITESNAEEIASICGFELTKEFEVNVTVQYSIMVNARDEESAENLIHDIDFDSVSEPGGVNYLSSTVDSIEVL
jgi:membrane-bound lytic murein transglycosylase